MVFERDDELLPGLSFRSILVSLLGGMFHRLRRTN